MSLGVFGGTFDPVHFGHLRLAEAAREYLRLDRVLFVPAGEPPLKPRGFASASARLSMVGLAIASTPAFDVEDLELKRSGPSYTVDTLRLLTERFPGERLWFLIGSDALRELDAWHHSEQLFPLASFGVVVRSGDGVNALTSLLPETLARRFRPTRRGLEHESGSEIRWIPFPPQPISATEIRRQLALGQSVRGVVPDPVVDYIEKHGLYRAEGDRG